MEEEKTMNKLLIAISLAVFLSGCASPQVVQVRQSGDKKLTCEEIADEIFDAEQFLKKARNAKGVTGTNAAAVIFFWPALLATYANASEATEAAQGRIDYLLRLADKKDCD